MLYKFESLPNQHHRPCVAISAAGLSRGILLMKADNGAGAKVPFRVMQRRAAGGAVGAQARGGGPLDALDMNEIAARALAEHGLDPENVTWDQVRALAQAAARGR